MSNWYTSYLNCHFNIDATLNLFKPLAGQKYTDLQWIYIAHNMKKSAGRSFSISDALWPSLYHLVLCLKWLKAFDFQCYIICNKSWHSISDTRPLPNIWRGGHHDLSCLIFSSSIWFSQTSCVLPHRRTNLIVSYVHISEGHYYLQSLRVWWMINILL